MSHISRSALHYFFKLPDGKLTLKEVENSLGLTTSPLKMYIADWEKAGLVEILYEKSRKLYRKKPINSSIEELEEYLERKGFMVTGTGPRNLKGVSK